MDDLFIRTLVAGVGVAMLAGMLGAFVVWRRVAYVGDAMSHAALLGVVVGIMAGIAPLPAVLVLAVLAGLVLSKLGQDRRLPFDALLMVISTGSLAAGLLLYDTLPARQGDIMGYLFGDILAVSAPDIYWIYGALALVAMLVLRFWPPLMRMVVHEDIARVEGVAVDRLAVLLMVLIALTVAVALQVVGMLLMTALMVIPPLAARSLARTPKAMVLGAMLVAIIAAVAGVAAAYRWNLAVGPAMVMAAVSLLAISRILGSKSVH